MAEQQNTQPLLQLSGTVSGLVYVNGGNGYTVLRLRTDERDTVTAVGCIPGAAIGERLTLTGSWITHPSFGDQFKVQQAERQLPRGKKAIYEYLAYGAVKGIGPATAAAIVTMFGEDALEVLESEPEKLSAVKGISARKAKQLGEEFRRQAGMRLLMEFLAQNGLPPKYAVPLWRCYGDRALEALKEDPYILTRDFFGADFFVADTLAESLGFETDSPRRVEAAVLFALTYNTENGHVFLPIEKLTDAVSRMLGIEEELALEAVETLCDCGLVVQDTVAGRTAIYLAKLYEAEMFVTSRVRDLLTLTPTGRRNADELIARVERRQNISYSELQRKAVELASSGYLMLLTGGPGTGKTTAVRAIADLYDEMGFRLALAAPTGRAAQRLSELTGREAFTIHRLLGAAFQQETGETEFSHDEDDPLEADAVIVDEASMLDILLTCALMRAMKPHARLILVGDADQLPPVGPGGVFSDMLRSGAVPAVRLSEIFRQAMESRIVKNAHLVNHGKCPELRENKGDFFFLQRGDDSRVCDTVTELVSARLPKNMGIPPERIQVLSPTRKHGAGTLALNKALREAMNPPAPDKHEAAFGDFVYREGDRVMQIRNNYDILFARPDGSMGNGIFNGDIGRIARVDPQKELVVVDFGDRVSEYSFESLGELEPAFAMTVHKSQGSEFDAVVLVIPSTAPMLMTRGVLYTAMTRAKKLLIVVGDGEAVANMAANEKRQRRYTGLKFRLSPPQ